MTEQPKLIESLNEAKSALGKTQRLLDEGWANCDISYTPFDELIELIDHGKLRWKPTEYEYVTMESFRLQELIDGKYQYEASCGGEWYTASVTTSNLFIRDLLPHNRLRRKKVEGGGEIELVEMGHVQPLGPVIYVLEGQEPFHSNYERTNRTFKGVIHEE